MKTNNTNQEFNIADESQDREYFAIVPNYITNHSTLEERGFYLTLKRIAGENSKVYYSARELAKQCGISKDTVYRLIKSLLKRGWIKDAGVILMKTKPRKTYSIVNLWDKNNEFYRSKKIVSNEGQSQITKEIVANEGQRLSQIKDTKENQYKEKLKNTVNGADSLIKKLPTLPIPQEQKEYIKDEILSQLNDAHSERFYRLVASKIPENIIREALSEIKVDGAKYPAKVFTYRMKRYALAHKPT